MESKEFNALVYSVVDNFLNDAKNGNAVLPNLQNTKEGQAAKNLLFEHKFITRRSNEITSIIDITHLGISVIEIGGIEKYLAKDVPDKIIKNLKEDKKLDLDIKNAELTNKYFWLPLVISIIALLLTIIQLIFK